MLRFPRTSAAATSTAEGGRGGAESRFDPVHHEAREVAATVCQALEDAGIRVVLSGGAVVSLYSDGAYASYDLDFVATGLARRVDPVMCEIGFRREGRHWRHPESDYWVDFPSGPPAVGDAVLTELAERETTCGRLRLLGPIDCVKDRRAANLHWDDAQGLEQALLVAERQLVDLEALRAGSKSEAALEKFRAFRERLGSRARSASR